MRKHWKISATILLTSMLVGTSALAFKSAVTENQNYQAIPPVTSSLQAAEPRAFNTINDMKLYSSFASNAVFGLVKGDGVTKSDRLYAWGVNDAGQLGVGLLASPVTTPVLVLNPAPKDRITHFANGENFSLVVINGNEIWATGKNQYGEFGNNLNDSNSTWNFAKTYTFPVGETITSISAGLYHVAAVTNNTKLYAWGRNSDGQLGLDDKNIRSTPTQVTTNISGTLDKVVCGARNTAIKTTNGGTDTLLTWGSNDNGQLGIGNIDTKQIPTAVTFALQGKIQSYYATYASMFLFTLDGSTNHHYAWGRNNFGQLGVGDKSDKILPTTISLTSTAVVSEVVGGDENTTLLISSTPEIKVAGSSTTSGTGTEVNVFTQISGVGKPTDITSTTKGTLLVNDGGLYAWGNNAGAYGNGTTGAYNTHMQIDTFSEPSVLAKGAKNITGISVSTAASDIYKSGSLVVSAFKEYVDTSKFPTGAVFSMPQEPKVRLNGKLELTVTASQSYAEPDGRKTLMSTEYFIILDGFVGLIKDSLIEYLTVPSGVNLNNISAMLEKGGIVQATELAKLINLEYFPEGTTYKLSNVTLDRKDAKFGSYKATLGVDKYYKDGLVNPTANTYDIEIVSLEIRDDSNIVAKPLDPTFNLNNIAKALDPNTNGVLDVTNFEKLYTIINFPDANKFTLENAKIEGSTYTATLRATMYYQAGNIVNVEKTFPVVVTGLQARPDSVLNARSSINPIFNAENIISLIRKDGSGAITNYFSLLCDAVNFPTTNIFTVSNDKVVGNTYSATFTATEFYFGGNKGSNKTFDIVINGLVSRPNSFVNPLSPYISEFDGIVSEIKTYGVIDKQWLGRLVDLSQFPVDTTFTFDGSTHSASKRDFSLKFNFVPTRVYSGGNDVENLASKVFTADIKFSPTPQDEGMNLALIIGLSVGGGILLLVIIAYIIWYNNHPRYDDYE